MLEQFRLPSERAKSWRFSQGYLKKTGHPAKVVDRAQAQAINMTGVTGISVSILPPDAHIHDKIVVDDKMRQKIKENEGAPILENAPSQKKAVRKSSKKNKDKGESN